MNELLPWKASFVRRHGQVNLVLWDDQPLPVQKVSVEVRFGSFLVEIEQITVPVVVASVRLLAGSEYRLYTAFVNELAPEVTGVLESLTCQPELCVMIVNSRSECLGQVTIPNHLRTIAQQQLAVICALAEKAAWEPNHFLAAQAIVEIQFRTAANLWWNVEST